MAKIWDLKGVTHWIHIEDFHKSMQSHYFYVYKIKGMWYMLKLIICTTIIMCVAVHAYVVEYYK